MVNMSLQLSQLISDIFTSSANEVITAAKIQKQGTGLHGTQRQHSEDLLNTFSQLLLEARIDPKELAGINLSAAVLSIICFIPGMVESTALFFEKGKPENKKDMERLSIDALISISQSMKANLTKVGTVKQVNLIKLLVNMPSRLIRPNAYDDLFAYIKSNLLEKNKEAARSFYQAWLVEADKKACLADHFKQSLLMYNQETMVSPVISVGEVAYYLGQLDSEQDEDMMHAYSDLLKDMLLQYRRSLNIDHDCLAFLDDMNIFLMHLVFASSRGGFFDDAMIENGRSRESTRLAFAAIFCAMMITPVNDMFRIPLTVLHDSQISSATLISTTLMTQVINHIRLNEKQGLPFRLAFSQSLSWLIEQNIPQQLLMSIEKRIRGFLSNIVDFLEKLEAIQQRIYVDRVEIESNPWLQLSHFFQLDMAADVQKDRGFFKALSSQISRGVAVDALLAHMNHKIQNAPVQKTRDISIRQAKMALLDSMCVLLGEENQINRETLIATAKQGKLSAYLQSRVDMAQSEILVQERQISMLKAGEKLFDELKQTMTRQLDELHRTTQILAQNTRAQSPTEIVIQFGAYTSLFIRSLTDMRCQMVHALGQIKALEN